MKFEIDQQRLMGDLQALSVISAAPAPIAAPASMRISIEGEGGHAGAVLMLDRHDAFLAAAEIALAIEAAAKTSGSAA